MADCSRGEQERIKLNINLSGPGHFAVGDEIKNFRLSSPGARV